MTQIHRGYSICEMLWFVNIEWRRDLSRPNRTEPATTCAFFSSDHESSIPAGPAIVNVWAFGFLTDRVKLVVFNSIHCVVENRLL